MIHHLDERSVTFGKHYMHGFGMLSLMYIDGKSGNPVYYFLTLVVTPRGRHPALFERRMQNYKGRRSRLTESQVSVDTGLSLQRTTRKAYSNVVPGLSHILAGMDY